MAIQIPNFQRISFQEANPLLTGFGAGQDIISNILKQRMTDLANQKAAAELPYAGQLAKSTADYKNAMARYLMSPGGQGRGLSSLGKLLNEQAAGLGSSKGTGNDVYGLAIQKDSTDPTARQKTLYSTNLEKTLSTIDPNALTTYTGISGLGKKGQDYLSYFLTGKVPQRMQDEEASARGAQNLATQVRQFYGDSIRPEVEKDLNFMTNPTSWRYDQPTAIKLFNNYASLLRREGGTYSTSLKNTTPYGGGVSDDNTQNVSTQVSQGSRSLSKNLQLPDFGSKQEFQEWYKKQPKMVRDAVKLSMSG